MTARSAAGLSSDPAVHAALYRDETQSPDIRNRALAALIEAYAADTSSGAQGEAGAMLADLLEPKVRFVARRVARGAGKSEREEFVGEALSLVLAPRDTTGPPICLYRHEEGSLEPWLQVVLTNRWRSRRRQAARLPPRCGEMADFVVQPVSGGEQEADLAAALTRPFSGADLDRVTNWGPRRRVELLCLAGLWLKVSPALWDKWVRAYENVMNRPLPRPFPPDEFVDLENPGSRTAPLAQLFGYSRPNTLSVRWARGQDLLEGLDFVRALRA